jgi:hypothetical protein
MHPAVGVAVEKLLGITPLTDIQHRDKTEAPAAGGPLAATVLEIQAEEQVHQASAIREVPLTLWGLTFMQAVAGGHQRQEATQLLARQAQEVQARQAP